MLLRTKDTDAEKLADIAAYAAPLEKRGVALEIRRGDEVFYRSAGCKDVLGRARQIVAFDSEKNVYHFGQDGLVIVSHVQTGVSAAAWCSPAPAIRWRIKRSRRRGARCRVC